MSLGNPLRFCNPFQTSANGPHADWRVSGSDDDGGAGVSTATIKVAIALAYVVFAILLNSVGAVILQSVEYFHVSNLAASTLEASKDLPIAVVSFLVANTLPRWGYRRSMIAGLLAVGGACVVMASADAFWATRLLFVAVGASFAVVKVAAYSSVGLLAPSPRAHASLLSLLEGVFMLGVLGGYFLFGAFVDARDPGSAHWLQVYWVLAAASFASAALLAASRLDETAASGDAPERGVRGTLRAMWALARQPLTAVFIAAVFLYVLIEQGVGTWLPTFNREGLGLSAPLSIQAASIFAAGLAGGRLAAGVIVRRTGWFPLLLGCLGGMVVLILVTLPLAARPATGTIERWADAPPAALLLPLVGAFMAPIYPILNSAVLSAIAPARQPTMVGLIVVISALGGTTGSFVIGRVFALIGPAQAFYLLLVPIAALAVAIVRLRAVRARAGTG